jgi:eukaryotic-like serine/threonine-protein kinase
MSIHPGLLGKYELRERLGQGGMAEVWKAYDQRLQRFVAIKFLHTMLQADPTFLARFVREAQAVASLRHPNIVQVFDFETSTSGAGVGKTQPLAFMVMDYVEGQTLAEYLATTVYARRFLAPAEVVSLFFSISSAVDYAHQHGLLHRDIKPANILLDRRHLERNPMGEPILTDFGIVKMQGNAAGTLTSSALGTPLYIAPEQALGQPLDAASDLYSLGVVLYEMCTGALPFLGSTPVAIIQQHIAEPPRPPSQLNPAIPPALDAVILRALAKKPVERFSSALAMTAALAEALRVPLPSRQSQAISSPDIRSLPASAPTLQAELSLGAGQIVPSGDLPTAVSAQPQLPTLLANPLPAPVQAQRPGGGPAADGILSMRVSSTPPRPLQREVTTPPLLSLPAPKSRRRRRLLILSLLCALLVLPGSGLAAFLYTRSQAPAASQMMGNAFFTSSGNGSGATNQGLNDIFQVRIAHVPDPAAGTQYYAWLLPDQIQTEASARLLGTLTLSAGVAILNSPYMDPQHANLIAQFSRFLVTEEPAHPVPQSPSLNTHTWRYYALIPQDVLNNSCQGAINKLSVLCHLRHLLANDPELIQVNLQGGLNYWFLNNVKELQKWSQEALDHNSALDVRHKIANILYLLDGNACVAQDLQQGAAGADNMPDDNTIHTLAAVPLMDCAQTPDSPGYLSHIHNHLNAVLQSPDIQRDQVAMGVQIGTELNTVNAWLQKLRSDARQLLAMNDIQLVQPDGRAKRSEMNALATSVLSGGTDPTTGALDKGAASISDQIQQLATLDVVLFSQH